MEADVTVGDRIRAAVTAHVTAVGAADPGALVALYAPDGRLYDPAGGPPVVGREAIAAHFADVLTEPRATEIVTITVSHFNAAVHFRATPEGGKVRDVIDTMSFDDQVMIVAMHVYADWAPGVPFELTPLDGSKT